MPLPNKRFLVHEADRLRGALQEAGVTIAKQAEEIAALKAELAGRQKSYFAGKKQAKEEGE